MFLLLLASAVLSLFGDVRSARAHPLGNFTINRYARIDLYQDVVRVTYVLDLAEIPSFQELAAIDSDNNGASAEELSLWADGLSQAMLGGISLSLNGERVALQRVLYEGSSAPGQSNLLILRMTSVYEYSLPGDVERKAPTSVEFADSNYADRLGWREIVIAPSPGAEVVSPAGFVDRSNELRSYPASSLSDAPDERSVRLTWRAGTGAKAPAIDKEVASIEARDSSGFASLIVDNPAWQTIALSLVAAFGFGIFHALGPGHGKTVVAAYLVGTRGTPRHAVALGLTVTATHTSTVYVLGFFALAASHYIRSEQLYLSLSVLSGLLVAGFGLMLLVQRLGLVRAGEPGTHRHGPWSRPHSHQHEEGHSHDHGAAGGEMVAAGRDQSQHIGWRGLLTLGVLGGLLPCPSAIVVMLAAVSLGQVFFGMLLIVAFSAGLAFTLTAIGIAVVLGHHLAGRLRGRTRLASVISRAQRVALIGSPAVIVVVGLILTAQAIEQGSGRIY